MSSAIYTTSAPPFERDVNTLIDLFFHEVGPHTGAPIRFCTCDPPKPMRRFSRGCRATWAPSSQCGHSWASPSSTRCGYPYRFLHCPPHAQPSLFPCSLADALTLFRRVHGHTAQGCPTMFSPPAATLPNVALCKSYRTLPFSGDAKEPECSRTPAAAVLRRPEPAGCPSASRHGSACCCGRRE